MALLVTESLVVGRAVLQRLVSRVPALLESIARPLEWSGVGVVTDVFFVAVWSRVVSIVLGHAVGQILAVLGAVSWHGT
jgi:hypothetical protein